MKVGNIEVYGVIYKITNMLNKKVYIGQTTIGFKKRYDNTKWWDKIHNKHLRDSVLKYGIENFKVVEVFDIAFSKEELDIKEKVYINIYKSNNRLYGYNKKEGGSHGLFSEESKSKMSEAHKGIKASEETKLKMSMTRKGKRLGKENPMYGRNPLENLSDEEYSKLIKIKSENMTGENNPMYRAYGENNPFYGKHHSEEAKKKISEKAKERYKDRSNNPHSKKVSLYKIDGEFVQSFDSFKSCSEWLLSTGVIKNIRTGDDAIRRSLMNNKPYKGYYFNLNENNVTA